MAEDTSSAESRSSADGEIGVMEKGGRLQFVTATGNDIQSRSPTPTSSENETETAARVEGQSEQENFQLDETYSQGSDEFEQDSDQENAQRNISAKQNLQHAELKSESSMTPRSSQVKMIPVGSLENNSILGSLRQASGLSVASQTEVDNISQLDQLVIDDGETELGQKQEESGTNKVTHNVLEETSSVMNSVEQSSCFQPSVEKAEKEGKQKRRKTPKLKKSPDVSLLTIETDSEDRQKINDLAFMNWLKNKNKEQQKKRKKVFVIPSEEETEGKRKMCEVAYKSWLVKKAKEDKVKKRTEKLQTEELLSEKRCSAEITFDIWLHNKLKQKRREDKQIEQEQQEQEQLARSVDREVSQEAYRR